jgi:hypothetical protein
VCVCAHCIFSDAIANSESSVSEAIVSECKSGRGGCGIGGNFKYVRQAMDDSKEEASERKH